MAVITRRLNKFIGNSILNPVSLAIPKLDKDSPRFLGYFDSSSQINWNSLQACLRHIPD